MKGKSVRVNKIENLFSGVCLMGVGAFEINHIFLNLRQNWNIKVNADTKNYKEEANKVSFVVEDRVCFIQFVDKKVSENEMKLICELAFPDTRKLLQGHTSHILVGVYGGNNKVETALLFTKISSSCLMQPNAIAIHCVNNTVAAKDFLDISMTMKEGFLPIENWIYIGIVKSGIDSINGYTVGMKLFGKDEIEIINSREDIEIVMHRLLNLAYFIIDNDAEFSEGDTITLNEFNKSGNKIPIHFKVEYSKAVNGLGKTIKILGENESI